MPIPFSTTTPEPVDVSGSAGNQQNLRRSNHVHAHGDLPGGRLHAEVSLSGAGFLPQLTGNDLYIVTKTNSSASWMPASASAPPSGTISQGGRNLFGSLLIALSNSIKLDEVNSSNNNIKFSSSLSESLWFGDISNNKYLRFVSLNNEQRIDTTNVGLQYKKRLTYHSGSTIFLINTDSGRLVSNSGSTGPLTASLPLVSSVADGYFLHGRIRINQYLIFKASGSDMISMIGNRSTPGGYVRSTFTGSSIELEKQSRTLDCKRF